MLLYILGGTMRSGGSSRVHWSRCRIQKTLRVTPGMEFGLTDNVWDVAELISEV